MITLTKFLAEAKKKAKKKKRIPQDSDISTEKKSAPKKYHEKLSKDTKKARAKHFEEHGKKADNDPSAYVPAPGDEKASTRESQYTKAYKKKFGEDVELKYIDDEFFMEEVDQLFPCEYEVLDEEMIEEDATTEGLKKKAEKSGIPLGILRQVFNRGKAAWKGGHRPGTTPEQWAYARCNSFISGGKTRTTADKDLWAKASAAKKKKKKGKNSGPPKKKSSKQ